MSQGEQVIICNALQELDQPTEISISPNLSMIGDWWRAGEAGGGWRAVPRGPFVRQCLGISSKNYSLYTYQPTITRYASSKMSKTRRQQGGLRRSRLCDGTVTSHEWRASQPPRARTVTHKEKALA